MRDIYPAPSPLDIEKAQGPFQRTATQTVGRSRLQWLGWGAAVVALLAGCATPLPPAPPPPPAPPAPPPAVVEVPPAPPEPVGALSYAKTPREYRKDAAALLYSKNAGRIFKGVMPPLLYAVGVLQVDLDPRGQVQGLRWMRAPTHAPEVMAEIERMVRQAAPYPVAVNLGHVTYTDTWLWHRSGRFQLDTLTEGQDANAREPDFGDSVTAKKSSTAKKSTHCKAKDAKC